MDPITQATVGAAATLAILPQSKRFQRSPFSHGQLALMGALGGMAPDLDILIRSASDPLVAIEYHRHFTHSLAFIPIGGPLVALPWAIVSVFQKHWKKELPLVALATTVGFTTHALLDACTTYGTLLLWPFSDHRVSWRIISVIDPSFTFPLLAAVILAIRKRSARWMHTGVIWGALYLCFGLLQQHRAIRTQTQIAEQRQHSVERAAVFPSFVNNVTWRSLYQFDGKYYVDKIRVPWLGSVCISPGPAVSVVGDVPGEFETNDPQEIRAHRLLRWFAGGWVARDPDDPAVLGDLRYSFAPNEATPIWGIVDRHQQPRDQRDSEPYQPNWVNNRRKRDIQFGDLYRLIFEDDPGALCL